MFWSIVLYPFNSLWALTKDKIGCVCINLKKRYIIGKKNYLIVYKITTLFLTICIDAFYICTSQEYNNGSLGICTNQSLRNFVGELSLKEQNENVPVYIRLFYTVWIFATNIEDFKTQIIKHTQNVVRTWAETCVGG